MSSMGSLCSKLLMIAVTGLAVGVADTALAQANIPNIMVDVDKNGIPIIAKRSHARPKRPEIGERQNKRAERPSKIPRGSSVYVQPIPLPNTSRASGIAAPPSVAPYNPPPINNPSERIHQLNQSFPLNGGLGNNPSDRDAYIRYNLNR